jgi:hypothetical protein
VKAQRARAVHVNARTWTVIGSAAWLALCATALLNWSRYGLAPEAMNPAQGQRVAALWIATMVVTTLWVGRKASWAPWAAALFLSAASLFPLALWPLALLTGGACLWSVVAARRPWWLLTVLLAFAASMLGAYERVFGRISAVSASTLFQTTPFESLTFVLHLVTPGLLVNWALFATSLWLFARRSSAAAEVQAAAGPLVAVLLLALLMCSPALLDRGLSLKLGLALHRAQQAATVPPDTLALRQAKSGIDIVWIIGESNSRWHWSLYGYPRSTTPRLSERASSLLVLRDAVAPHSYTVQSLMQSSYRPMSGDEIAGANRNASIVDVLRSASVRVHWISAQERFGPWATPITSLADRADTKQFVASHLRLWGSSFRGPHPDHDAQAAMLGLLAQPTTGSRVLVHHMFAAHDPYCVHRPRGASPPDPWQGVRHDGVFGVARDQSAALGCYENAVRFTDELLDVYIDAAQKAGRATVVMFVPDHGEAPEEGTGHNVDRPSARHIEIPAVLYFNDAAQKQLAVQHSALASHVDAPFFGSWTYELLLDLLEIPADGLLLRTRSPASGAYRPPQRTIYAEGRPWNYDDATDNAIDDVLSRTRNTLRRVRAAYPPTAPVFAHRVNTLLKAQEAARYFDGAELDIVFDSSADGFFVYHPPMPNTGLRLAQQLQALANNPELQLWFDFKNPSREDVVAGLAQLETLDSEWQLKRRAILEIPEARESDVFAAYASAGWRVSLNIGDDFAACNSRPATDVVCRDRAHTLTRKAHAVGLHALSFDYKLWSAVGRFVVPLKANLRLYSWRLDLKSDDTDLPQRLAEMPQFAGLIVTFPSRFSP